MARFGRLFLALLVVGILVVGAGEAYRSVSSKTELASVLDRVQKAGTLRCGYASFDPYVVRDPNTGKVSGITVDYLEQTAARYGLKVTWDHEINIDQVIPSIELDRIDMFCLPCSPLASWEERIDFRGSFGKIPYYVYVPVASSLNAEDLKTARFAVMDGYIPSVETPVHFPQAALSSLLQTASMAELYDQLKYGKADAVLNEHISALNYIRHNPDVIRRFSDVPLFTKTMSFPVKKNDLRWSAFVQQMTDTTQPENQQLFRDLMERYGLIENALLY